MTRRAGSDLGPSLLIGTGIVVATLVAVLSAGSGWLVLAAPLVLTLAVVGAGMMSARLGGESWTPSWAALILGGSFLLASWIVALRDPSLVGTLLPVFGAASWLALLPRLEAPRRSCGPA